MVQYTAPRSSGCSTTSVTSVASTRQVTALLTVTKYPVLSPHTKGSSQTHGWILNRLMLSVLLGQLILLKRSHILPTRGAGDGSPHYRHTGNFFGLCLHCDVREYHCDTTVKRSRHAEFKERFVETCQDSADCTLPYLWVEHEAGRNRAQNALGVRKG